MINMENVQIEIDKHANTNNRDNSRYQDQKDNKNNHFQKRILIIIKIIIIHIIII